MEIVEPDQTGSALRTRYEVDYWGRVLSITDNENRTIARYDFAGPGQAIAIRTIDNGNRKYWYDAAGKLRLREDHLGRRLRMDYDEYGRLTEAIDESIPGQPRVIRSMQYQGPKLMLVTEENARIRYNYDRVGREEEKTIDYGNGKTITLRREYGVHGELKALIYPDATRVEVGYHNNGSVSSLSGFVDRIHYNEHSDPAEISYTGGATTTYHRGSSMHRLLGAELRKDTNLVRSYTLSYNQSGQIASIQDQLPGQMISRRFHYDFLNRLERVELFQGDFTGPVLRDDRYTYSPTGNLTRNDESGLAIMEYTNPAHPSRLTGIRRATEPSVTNLVYDQAGRLSNFENISQLNYDFWDRLTSAQLRDGTIIRFEYDHFDQRIRKVVEKQGAITDTYYFDKLFQESANERQISIYLGDVLVALQTREANGALQKAIVLTDYLGSILATCTPDGTPLQQQMYSAFGRPLRLSGDHTRYTGEAEDQELGLIQMGSRYYAPELGRFITPDWFIFENPDQPRNVPQGFNVYSYAINNPVMFHDPSGNLFFLAPFIGAAASSAFGTGLLIGTTVGLAQGKNFGESLLVGLESGLLGAIGTALAANTAIAALGPGASTAGAIGPTSSALVNVAASIGKWNGIISGAARIYSLDAVGLISFLSDSTWGLLGTGLGLLLHGVNVFYITAEGGSRYNFDEDQRRKNRHIYDGGFGFPKHAFSQGNVISHFEGDKYPTRYKEGKLIDHEMVHVWQNRIFGPVYQTTYYNWMIGGTILAFFDNPMNAFKKGVLKKTTYCDNPFEVMAYNAGGTCSY